jgi:hypothetical protein
VPAAGSPAPADAWSEHLWARLCGLVGGLEALLDGAGEALDATAHGPRFEELLQRWQTQAPVASTRGGARLSHEQAQRLAAIMQLLRQLHVDLQALPRLPQRPRPPATDFGLRPPL